MALLPANASAQALYGTIAGTVTDDSGAAIPGATVTVVNEGTGLQVSGVTDETGAYAIRNLQPGTWTVKASLQGFKEYIQTGVPVAQNDVSRVDGKLEVGALTESVTVTTDSALLKTDKADVSVNLKPADVVNLPLNQYRNYQGLMNLVPGATPTVTQNNQVDTPARALATNVNGTNNNNNVTRIDGAASINVWLPHHAGYIAPVETIETVNISTNSFDASQGMTGGAAVSVATKSGTNQFRGSAFWFRNQDNFNARQGYLTTLENPESSVDILGGTVGGPIKKNNLFFFGGWERNLEKNSFVEQFTVPTARMRQGDFSEVLAVNPNFKLYDPATGNQSTGAGRAEFPGAVIPASRISSISQTIQSQYPAPNAAGTNSGLQNNYEVARFPEAKRDNVDFKVNWNRTSANQIWAKYSMMDASVQSLFKLPFDEPGGGDTTVDLWSIGQTYTINPTLIWDATFGSNVMEHASRGPDYGTNYGLDLFKIPGTNSAGTTGPGSADPLLYSGMPQINTGLGVIGNNDGWTPVQRREFNYTFSTNVTKVAGRHEIRSGFDLVKLGLDHWQPEFNNPRGTFSFNGAITGIPGYSATIWNNYGAFLLGQMSEYGKSVQFEEMTTNEDQYGLYINDRWQVSDKLTLNAGLRWEYYPLMQRDDRSFEQLDLATFNVLFSEKSSDLGYESQKNLFAPRVGAAYRINDDTVFRAGYGRTFNPLPWSRPLRGFYPSTIAYGATGPVAAIPYGDIGLGIPPAANPDLSTGVTPLPRGVTMRTPEVGNVQRGTIDSWNVFVERRLPGEISLSTGYVGTATNNGYADLNLNYAESGGNANRQFSAQAGTADILLWGARTKARYHSLQMAVNRPFRNGLLLKGAYTFSKALNEADDDGWVGLSWNQPSQIGRNYARAGYDRPHMLQMGFVYELPWFREDSGVLAMLLKAWQINGIGSWVSGTPFSVTGDNALLNQQGGLQTGNVSGELEGNFNEAGPNGPWYDPSQFSQPGNAWGNSGRNSFRGPSNWNLDFSLFKAIPVGRYRMEFRAESSNVLNHTQWASPATADRAITSLNFMRLRTLARTPRRIQLGLRFAF
ncbi:TonB-dependent receptor [Luteitalea pratensis]|uniref:TonB-dependent receptor n=1 Tax=Luteitalea pratensis TaxID=1855912 RepID=UPI0013900016|nr:TonB-dependent receptor [Luteitalea pratensis]